MQFSSEEKSVEVMLQHGRIIPNKLLAKKATCIKSCSCYECKKEIHPHDHVFFISNRNGIQFFIETFCSFSCTARRIRKVFSADRNFRLRKAQLAKERKHKLGMVVIRKIKVTFQRRFHRKMKKGPR